MRARPTVMPSQNNKLDDDAVDIGTSESASASDIAPLVSVEVKEHDGHAPAAATTGEGPLDSAYFSRVAPPLTMWLSLSIGLILFNKYLYISVFRHPITLTAVHMIFMTVVTQCLSASGRLKIPALGWPFYFSSIIPLAVMFAVSLAASNIAAQRLSVSFIQMIKAVTPMMTLAVCVIAGTEKFQWALVVITVTMTVGVSAASLGEIEFDLIGFALQFLALTVESVRLVAIQRVVQKHLPKPSNPLVALSLFAPPCAAILFPASLIVEHGAMWKLAEMAVGPIVALNAVCALFLNFAVVWLVSQESGPLTLTVSCESATRTPRAMLTPTAYLPPTRSPRPTFLACRHRQGHCADCSFHFFVWQPRHAPAGSRLRLGPLWLKLLSSL